MLKSSDDEPSRPKPLRLWPGVVVVALQWLVRFVVPVVVPEAIPFGVIGGMAGGLGIVVWWLFFSRAPWFERLSAIGLMIVALFATSRLVHESIATGAMGMLFAILAIPVLSLGFVAGVVISRRFTNGARRAVMVAAILLACGVLTLVRTGGITGNFDNDLKWRWAETPEERLLAQVAPALTAAPVTVKISEEQLQAQPSDKPVAPSPAPAGTKTHHERHVISAEDAAAAPAAPKAVAEWPGFRGPGRDGIIHGVQIETNWSAAPPVELWRRPVGPGWSSFAARGDFFYTQEQRGDNEIVVCYNMTTGVPVWMHHDSTRFWESNGGAGPRATPALSNGRVYTFGGTGILNALDAGNGSVVWSRNVASDAGVKVPEWGFTSSPLVVDSLVISAAAGKLVAYDLATGEPRWFGKDIGDGYSSPHLLTLDGVAQVLLLGADGVISLLPADGSLLWQHGWPGDSRIVQPAVTADGDILLGSGFQTGIGMRRIAVVHGPEGWTIEKRWTSIGLKPYFNDFVVHQSHAFGFDGSILACIDLKDGKRKWKGGRYGNGQLLLLANQGLLLVLSEQGELALVVAAPDQFTELARFPAIKGKTWNHPVLVGDILLVRNDHEMVAFRLSLARS